MKVTRLFLIVFLFMRVQNSFAQTYNFEYFNEESGLEQTYIYSVSQSTAGYLYMATGEGLYRFDGSSFTAYTNKHLSTSFVTTHFIDSNDVVWMGHNQNGVSYLKNSKIYSVSHPALAEAKVTNFFPLNRDLILIATNGAGLFTIDTTRTIKPVAIPDMNQVLSLCRANNSQILAASATGVNILTYTADKKLKLTGSVDFLQDKMIRQIIPSAS